MAEFDYAKLGFKAGLEIHQQLETHKLFCECASDVRGKKKDICFSRFLRAAAGEAGAIDIAAAYEMKKSKRFDYVGDSTLVCLVDMDEEPPRSINTEALDTALLIAKMFHARVVDQIEVMRKIVVDGSNVTGFQRTMLIAEDGYIETSRGNVAIPMILLEEESAQKLEATGDAISYNLDRLGVPMIEISTDASIKDPEHTKEAAEKIGMILRSSGKVKRGLGTIRQDVNVSIKGHPRVEIKGFQELKSMPAIVRNEVMRQLDAIAKGEKLEGHVRNSLPDGTSQYLRPMPTSARMYPETDIPSITPAVCDMALPELLETKIEKLVANGLNKDLATRLARKDQADFTLSCIERYPKLKPTFIADTLIATVAELKRDYDMETKNEDLYLLFGALNAGKVAKESMVPILRAVGGGEAFSAVVERCALMSDDEVTKVLERVIADNKGKPFNALIGIAMAELRGKAEGKRISSLLKKLVG